MNQFHFFVRRLQNTWRIAQQNLEKSVQAQKKYYDKKRKDVQFSVGDLVLLSTTNLRMKNVPSKLQRKFVGPFSIVDKISPLVYKVQLPDTMEDSQCLPYFIAEALEAVFVQY